jgi:putative restriction endonuclease
VTSLSDFLEITPAQARAQWRRIAGRDRPPPGKRQEKFLPVEVLLCFGLFYELNPHSFGGANIHKVPDSVKSLAQTFKRSAGSITNKMLNLDGSRPNSGTLERELFRRLTLTDYPDLYQVVLSAAREAGLGPARVPDFLATELLGQDELGAGELDRLLDERREEIDDRIQRWDFTEQETTRLVMQRARLGQHRFARAVLDNYGGQCGFCGFAPQHLPGHRLLIASHIKPWRDSSDRERLDPRNGIAACPVHDTAFDTGLLRVNGGLKIHRARALERSLAADAGSVNYFGQAVLRPTLLPPRRDAPGAAYLEYHRRHIFQGG